MRDGYRPPRASRRDAREPPPPTTPSAHAPAGALARSSRRAPTRPSEVDAMPAARRRPCGSTPRAASMPSSTSVGIERLRVVREAGRPIAGAASIAAAQFFGGRTVPSALVTAVWVAPAARGRGVASGLIEALTGELRAEGFPISALYPANLAALPARRLRGRGGQPGPRRPARRARSPRPGGLAGRGARGPHAAGARPARRAPRGGAAPPRRRAPRSAARRCGTRCCAGRAAARTPPSSPARPAASRAATSCSTPATRSSEINVRELLGLEPDATRALLAHLAGYRGIFETARWPGGPFDPAAHLLRGGPTRTQAEPLMIAMLDPAAALAARGYPAGLTARLELDVEGAGPLVLELDGSGTGRVAPGGAGAIRVGRRALAPLYTGFARPARSSSRAGSPAPGRPRRARGRLRGPQPRGSWTASRPREPRAARALALDGALAPHRVEHRVELADPRVDLVGDRLLLVARRRLDGLPAQRDRRTGS